LCPCQLGFEHFPKIQGSFIAVFGSEETVRGIKVFFAGDKNHGFSVVLPEIVEA
jgi:hypothetical protein